MFAKGTIIKILIFIIVVSCIVRFFIYEKLIVKLTPFVQVDCHNYCYSLDENRHTYRYFSSFASYPRVEAVDFINHVTVPNCKPVKIWSIFRHGARWPSKEEVTDFSQLYEIRDEILRNYGFGDGGEILPTTVSENCRLCTEDLELFQNWKMIRLRKDEYNNLAPLGKSVSRYLAKSYREAFPDLYVRNYSTENYLFRTTSEYRSTECYESFVDYLFGYEAHVRMNIQADRGDTVLTHYFFCNETEERANGEFKEVLKFQKQAPYTNMMNRMNKKLGLNLTSEQFANMTNMCVLTESCDNNTPSPWCSIFTPLDRKILNYEADISLYNMKSYGYKMNTDLGCSVIVDMLNYLGSTDEKPKVAAYFVHSTLMFLVLTTLELIKDNEPLLATNFDRMDNRNFQSTEKVPLSANFAAVKYDCPDDKDKVKVMFLLNQKPVYFPQCEDEKVCTWRQVMQILGKYTEQNCDKVYCKNVTLNDLYAENYFPFNN